MDFDLQKLMDLLAGVDSYEVGIGGTVREFLVRMQFVETMNELLPWGEQQCGLSPGQRILALAFIEDPRALFRMPEVYARRDVELLGEGVKAEQLNDKALGRALEALRSWRKAGVQYDLPTGGGGVRGGDRPPARGPRRRCRSAGPTRGSRTADPRSRSASPRTVGPIAVQARHIGDQ